MAFKKTLQYQKYREVHYLHEYIVSITEEAIEASPSEIEFTDSESGKEVKFTLNTLDELIDVLNDFKKNYELVKQLNPKEHGNKRSSTSSKG